MLAKRLKRSDCSYFEQYFRDHPNGRQKAINLDQAKIKSLFPRMAVDEPRLYPVQVDWFFNGRAPIRRTQNISLSQKNWRLNSMPWVNVAVEPGNIIVCQMLGDDAPTEIRLPTGIALALIRPDDPEFGWFDARLPDGGFVNLDDDELIDSGLPIGGHVWRLIDFLTEGVFAIVEDVIADAAGNAIPKLALRSIEESGTTRAATEEAEKLRAAIGLGGETLVDAYLEHKVHRGEIASYRWISKTNKLAPVDFGAHGPGLELAIEVKTTKGKHETSFYISVPELRAGRSLESYEIWRVSGFEWTHAELVGSIRKTDPSVLVHETLDWLDLSPKGVEVPTVRFRPDVLTWTEPEVASCARSRVPSETWERDITLAS